MQRSGVISPRSESPSKREGLSSFFSGTGKKNDVGKTNLLVTASIVLNVIVIALLLFYCHSGTSTTTTSEATPLNLAANPNSLSTATTILTEQESSATAALLAANQREITSLQASLEQARSELSLSQESLKMTNDQLKDLQSSHSTLMKQYESLKASQSSVAPVVIPSSSGACACREHDRLGSDDLALLGEKFDLAQHEFEWKCDEDIVKPKGNQTFCPETATSEQYFQLTFFDRPGAGSKVAVRKGKPHSPTCVQLPPRDYKWPQKHQQLPVPKGADGVNWPNLRVKTLKDLLVFNRGTPKNLYHFNASFYDYEQEQIVSHAARYIPFDQKVRLMLDIGSGGGSLGLVLKRRYDVQTVSTVFADWPYCEYITERGNICMYLDAMEAMPFAKFSYDLVHSSWVFHALLNHQLVHTFLEQNRIIRPGGYIWLNGGWSNSQVSTIENLFLTQLGYTVIYNHKKPVPHPGRTKFDTVPFELEWEVIMVKPIRADEKTCRIAQAAHNAEGTRGRN